MPVKYTQAGLVVHSNGTKEIVVMGGISSSATQILDLDKLTWTMGGNFSDGKLYAGSSIPYGNTFLVVGGYIAGPGEQNSIWEYEVDTGNWKKLDQEMMTERSNFAATLVHQNSYKCY